MKYAKWTDEHNDILREKYGKMPNKDLAAIIGRSVASIKSRARRLGLTNAINRGMGNRMEHRIQKYTILPKVRTWLQYAPVLPVCVLLQGRYKQSWKKDELWLYLAALIVQVGRGHDRMEVYHDC